MAEKDNSDDEPEEENPQSDAEVVDLTTAANQTWLNEPGPSFTPYRKLEDEDEKEKRREELEEAYQEVVGESGDS